MKQRTELNTKSKGENLTLKLKTENLLSKENSIQG
jgi:hypothetical protein